MRLIEVVDADARQCRREKDRARYAAMTFEKKQELLKKCRESSAKRYEAMTREERTIHSMMPCHQNARRKYNIKQKELICMDSIAIENPEFSPKLVWSSSTTQRPQVSKRVSEDMIVPELSPTPFVPTPSYNEEVVTPNTSIIRQANKRRVPSGERGPFVARQNHKFHSTVGRKFAMANSNSEMESDMEDEIHHQTTPRSNNHGNY